MTSKNIKKQSKKKQKAKSKTSNLTPLKSVTPCHYGNVAVTKTPFPLFGAGWSRGFHIIPGSIVIDLADVIIEPKVTFWNMEVPPELNDRYSPNCSIIRIQWVDGGTPNLSPMFWHKLADWLEVQNKPVVISCMGGHGRTGTALAILAGIYRLHGTSDIGEWVRTRHCHNAIETYGQVDYIEEVLGEKTLVKPSWAHEMETWKNWRSANTYVGDNMTTKKGNHPLIDKDQKVFGWFDKNDVYHTGFPPDSDNVSMVVSQDLQGNDVFEYIYDKDTDGFLPSY